MTAIINSTGFTVTGLDGFCGYGGSSSGILKAGVDLRAAFNHNILSIECYGANYPGVDLWQADVCDDKDPQFIDRYGNRVPGRFVDPISLPYATFCWFSPGCQHHSPSNAHRLYAEGRQVMLFADGEEFDEAAYANSERSRMTMACVLRYAAHHKPELIVTENVVEVCQWGADKDGSTFRWWLNELKKIGYEYHLCFFNSMFFPPCPQSRDRVYIVAWRRGNRKPDLDYRPVAYCISQKCGGRIVNAVQTWKRRTKAWPLPVWGKYKRQYFYACPDCASEVEPAAWPAWTAIDWSNLGIPIGEREALGLKRLAPATMERLRRGASKFRHYPPVVIPIGAWGQPTPTSQPCATQTTLQDKALLSGGVIPQRSHNQPVEATGQVPPVTTAGGGGHALLSATVVAQRNNTQPGSPADQVNSLTAHGDMSLASMIIKNNGDASEAKYRALPVIDPFGALTTSPTQAIASMIVAAKGHTFERGAYARARHVTEQLFTQHTSEAYGVANMPALVEMHGGGSGERPVTEPSHSVLAGGRHHGLMTTPFLLNGQNNGSAHHVGDSAFTAKCDGVQQLVTSALFTKFNGGPGDTSWHHTGEPFNTVTTADTHGLVFRPWVEQFLTGADPVYVTEQLATVMTHLRHALACMEGEGEPGAPITDEDLARMCFRMLEPDPELRYIMAFGPEHKLLGTKTQVTAGLGNAVTPPTSEWITERCLATLRPVY